ncbi:MAG: AmmeMemoRadiSam system protein B [Anaerolineae bacterium]
MQNQKIRRPAVAGAFYPAQAEQLRAMLHRFLEQADPPPLTGVRALIVPHAGYVYSGPIAAYGYKLLAAQSPSPSRAILMGPSHRVWFQGVALGDYTAFQTPLGPVSVDRAFLQTLAEEDAAPFHLLARAHDGEHCLEVQLPFLQMVLPDVAIAPLLFGELEPTKVGEALASHLTEADVIVVSSDLSHYHPYEQAQRLDQAFIEAVLDGDRRRVGQGEACGQAPILSLMTVAEGKGWQPHLLDYRNSGDTSGERRQVVGYTAIAYTEV